MIKTTSEILFKFVEEGTEVTVQDETRSYTAPSGWFKNIQSEHEKHGLQFIFPLKHPQYTDETQTILTNIEPNEIIRMTLTPTNEQHTAWRVYEIIEHDEETEL